jgi:hypothetical protein
LSPPPERERRRITVRKTGFRSRKAESRRQKAESRIQDSGVRSQQSEERLLLIPPPSVAVEKSTTLIPHLTDQDAKIRKEEMPCLLCDFNTFAPL